MFSIAFRILILLTICSCTVVSASSFESGLRSLNTEQIARGGSVFASDDSGFVHVAFFGHRFIGYTKLDVEGNLQFPIVKLPAPYMIEDIGIGLFCDGNTVVLYEPTEGDQQFAMIDRNGAVLDSGVVTGQSTNPIVFRASDGNAVLWGFNTGQRADSKVKLPVILQNGDAKLFVMSKPTGMSLTYPSGFHMPNDSTILVFTYQRVERRHPYNRRRISYNDLFVYKYDTWQGRIVDSTSIPLVNNPGIISYDLPFERVQIVNDDEGNMLVFASYVHEETGPELRVIRLSPDLEVLPLPDLQISADLPSVVIPKGTEYKRLFWFTHDRIDAVRSGRTLGLHQLVVTKDKLLHSEVFDIPSKH